MPQGARARLGGREGGARWSPGGRAALAPGPGHPAGARRPPPCGLARGPAPVRLRSDAGRPPRCRPRLCPRVGGGRGAGRGGRGPGVRARAPRPGPAAADPGPSRRPAARGAVRARCPASEPAGAPGATCVPA
ncbi:hypothetical protein VULLAG_LOCUS18850 [Vulpes lagopus]